MKQIAKVLHSQGLYAVNITVSLHLDKMDCCSSSTLSSKLAQKKGKKWYAKSTLQFGDMLPSTITMFYMQSLLICLMLS